MQYDAPYEISKRPGDAGYDLRTTEDFSLGIGESRVVDTMARFNIPPGIVGLLITRSGLGSRGLRLVNQVGVIDSSFNGPEDTVKAVIRNEGSELMRFKAGDRICQIIFSQLASENIEKGDWNSDNRGGFGSTGC